MNNFLIRKLFSFVLGINLYGGVFMSKARSMLLGGFIGDALALGPHWIYNVEDIKKKFGKIEGYTEPNKKYHKTKIKGDFTHYGDQCLMTLEYLSYHEMIEPHGFYDHYVKFFDRYNGYIDHATKETLKNLKKKRLEGSTSDELGGFTKALPIIFKNPTNFKYGLEQVLLLTKLTHSDPALIERVAFLTEVIYKVMKGEQPRTSIEVVKQKSPKRIYEEVEKAKNYLHLGSVQAIKQIGQSCSSEYAFTAVVYFILKYNTDFEQALLENAMAGGDSAARGMVIGAIIGAGIEEIQLPIDLLMGLNQLKNIERYMA